MGLCSALKECSHERVWVISCDMPLVDWNVAQELEDYLMDGIDAVIPVGKTGKKICALCMVQEICMEDIGRTVKDRGL